jgi:hypothetical protein
MGNGMPYHLEKGPVFSVFEASKYQTPTSLLSILGKLREKTASGDWAHQIWELDPYDDPALNSGPWGNKALREFHMRTHWFGDEAVIDPNTGAVTGYTKQKPTDFDPATHRTTGWWHNYFGDVEAIMRETLTRACEIALGLDHGAVAPTDPSTVKRCWPIDFVITCPAAWFEGWLCWRKTGPNRAEGHVTVHIVAPAHLHPNDPLGRPLNLKHPRDGGVLDSPLSPPQKGGDKYVERPTTADGTYGMWVITHANHDMAIAQVDLADGFGNVVRAPLLTTSGSPIGQWPLPTYGLVYHGVPNAQGGSDVLCVQPAEADGGVLPAGRGN